MALGATEIAIDPIRRAAFLLAAVAASCGVAPPTSFEGDAIDYVLPVSELPTGSRVTSEGGLDAGDLDESISAGQPGTVKTDLKTDGFRNAYIRSFRVMTETTAFDAESIVLVFANPAGAQASVSKRREAWVRYGYHPISLPQKLGDLSHAISVDGKIPGTNGGPDTPTSVVRVLASLANIALIVSIQDVPKDINPLNAVFVANKQIEFLRSAPQRPSRSP